MAGLTASNLLQNATETTGMFGALAGVIQPESIFTPQQGHWLYQSQV